MKELHLTKKDFKVEWYSGQGAGGQHRNKHQNCCRITHIESGLKAQGTESRERTTNQRNAFTRLAKLILAKFYAGDPKNRFNAEEVIRNYHGVRNEVLDKASGLKEPYKLVVDNRDIDNMIKSRKMSISEFV